MWCARVQTGPRPSQTFLDAMRKLKVVLDHFSTNNPELENVRSRYKTWGDALFWEFRDQL